MLDRIIARAIDKVATPPAFFVSMRPEQLIESKIPDNYFFRIQARLKTSSERIYTLQHYPGHVKFQSELLIQSESGIGAEDYIFDQEYVKLEAVIANTLNPTNIARSPRNYLDPESKTTHSYLSTTISLPWLLTQANVGRNIDKYLKNANMQGIEVGLQDVIAVFRGIRRSQIRGSGIPLGQISSKPLN